MITAARDNRRDYFGRIEPTPVIGICSWLLMIIMGTDIINASLLTIAIVFGLMSIGAAGGIRTAPGLLNLVMILKFVLIAVALKSLTLQPSDSNLKAPRTTSEVMAIGFVGMYLGSVIYRYSVKIKGVVKGVSNSSTYLWLTVVFSIACLGSAFVILVFQTSYETMLAGGFWGIAHQLQSSSSFCVVPALYYAWSSGSRRFLSHPIVLIVLFVELGIGLASTTKQGIMEPLLCYLGLGFIRYGFRSKIVLSIMGSAALLYVMIIYPYSQYVRSHGGRDGSLQERWNVIQEVFMNVATDADYRQTVDSQITGDGGYLGKDSLQPISRLAMIGEADRLIAATDATQSYTGWYTIVSGFSLMVPSFLGVDKSNAGIANFLGHLVGELALDDFSTQISYGFMANLYNAFGLHGVFFGTIVFIAIFYYVLRLGFAAPNLTLGPWGSSIWYVLLGMSFEHSLVELPLGYNFPLLNAIATLVGLIYLAKLLEWCFDQKKLRASLAA